MVPLFDVVTLLIAMMLTRQNKTGKYPVFKDLRGGNLATPPDIVVDLIVSPKIGAAGLHSVTAPVAAFC